MSFPQKNGMYLPIHVRVAVEDGDRLGAGRIAEFLQFKEGQRVAMGLPSRRTACGFRALHSVSRIKVARAKRKRGTAVSSQAVVAGLWNATSNLLLVLGT